MEIMEVSEDSKGLFDDATIHNGEDEDYQSDEANR